MPDASDIAWFKQNFSGQIGPKIQGTLVTVDMLAALACQETGEVWPILRRKGLSVAQVLALCVGDTIDSNGGRGAFPLNKADLLRHANGQQMFGIARQALVDMAAQIPSYQRAAQNPNKFCHAFGIFQYDLQFLDKDPDYFLKKQYEDFGIGLDRALKEIDFAINKLGFKSKTSLTDFEMACVGIVYNTGHFNPRLGLNQGHFDGKFYGQALFDFIRLAHTVAGPAAPATLSAAPGVATIAAPTPIASVGPLQVADTGAPSLMIRSDPSRDPDDPKSNVIGEIPDGHPVAVNPDEKPKRGFTPVETSLLGAHMQGFAMTKFLSPAPAGAAIDIVQPAPTAAGADIPAAFAPIPPGTIVRRTKPAGAQSLNEAGQPGRSGTSADELRAELAAIIEWLAVDDPSHVRYAPVPGKTFCNIYVHDYCHLAGVYVPRVWWTGPAIASFARGDQVAPNVGTTVDEQRANDLFRWLRDFGPGFGRRRTGTATKLQTEVNQGAIGIIVARRKNDNKSGHIVVVVPETDDQKAKRNSAGDVVSPLQSQAGARNFQYGGLPAGWWNGDEFAESAFWLHA